MKGRRTSEDANTDLKDEKGLLKVQIGQVEDIANGPSPCHPILEERRTLHVESSILPSIHPSIHTYIPTSHTYIHTYIHPSIHPSIHTYFHIHTYIYTYNRTSEDNRQCKGIKGHCACPQGAGDGGLEDRGQAYKFA